MVKKNNSTFRSPSVSGSTVMIFMAYSFLLELHLLSFRSELRSCGETLLSKSPGSVRVGRDLDHEDHVIFGSVAECTADYSHCVLVSDSLETLTVH